MKAIKKTADRIKEDIPEAYQDSVTKILNDLNSREFKMRIVAEFATSSLDDINKAFRKRFIEAGTDAANAQMDATQKGLDKIIYILQQILKQERNLVKKNELFS
jgi:hypothetical protein